MTTPKGLGIRLLAAIRENDRSEAFKLLREKNPSPDVKCTDRAGWKAIHFAALNGLVDILEKLIELGAEVNAWDSNGQTPLHKAARAGHIDAVVALVAHGAIVFTVDWHSHTPLELAVIERNDQVIDILFWFGSDITLQNWEWAKGDNHDKVKKKMIDLFKRQNRLNPGYKYGGIHWHLQCIEKNSESEISMEELNLTFINSGTKEPFYMYCNRMQSEYSDLKSHLAENQELFSDFYQCKCWQLKNYKREFVFKITIPAHPGMNDKVVFISPCGKGIGKIVSVDKLTPETDGIGEATNKDGTVENNDENQEITIVTISVKLRQQEMTSFAVVLEEKTPEMFQISKAAVTIQPDADPDAVIDIPEGAFEEAGELSVQFVETKDINDDEVDGPILLTNVLDISMSDNQQPQEDIKMKLPIQVDDKDQEEEMVIVCTADENPETEDDWDIIEAEMKKSKKRATLSFNASHFSIYAGAGAEKVKKSKAEVTEAIQRSRFKNRKIHICVMTKLQNEDEAIYSMIVECATPSKIEKRVKKRKKEKYEMIAKSEELIVQDNQTFRLTVDGNIVLQAIESINLDYQSKRQNFQACEFTVKDRDEPGTGTITIEVQVEKEQPDQVENIKTGIICTKMETKRHKQDPILDFEKTADIGIEVKVPKKKQKEAPKPGEPDPDDLEDFDYSKDVGTLKDECMIRVLTYKSLYQLATFLTLEEGEHIAHQLRFKQENLDKILQQEKEGYMKTFEILGKWRGRRPHDSQVELLINAVKSCQRLGLAEMVKEAADNDTYLTYNY